ncbi:Pentatricopeptide repeat [Dillenia turbinata]|uniref:Pentatricopeptide repeat n=1 Tax=Dillenia turbinata TaxID=194707 RepID=A0AAN8VS61_9MAGN
MGCFEDGYLLFVATRQERVLQVNYIALSCYLKVVVVIIDAAKGFRFTNAENKVFQMMSNKDVVSWNSLIAGCVQNGEVEEAYEFFEKMMVKDDILWTTMINGFSGKGITNKSVELLNMMSSKDEVTGLQRYQEEEPLHEECEVLVMELLSVVRWHKLASQDVLHLNPRSDCGKPKTCLETLACSAYCLKKLHYQVELTERSIFLLAAIYLLILRFMRNPLSPSTSSALKFLSLWIPFLYLRRHLHSPILITDGCLRGNFGIGANGLVRLDQGIGWSPFRFLEHVVVSNLGLNHNTSRTGSLRA